MNVALAILNCAALLVPRRQRAEWLDEWRAELWYVREQGERPVAFCSGAFRDAWWIRRNRRPSLLLETPLECLGWLGSVALVSGLLCFAIPGARSVLLPFPYPASDRLAVLSPMPGAGSGAPAMTVGQYRNLRRLGLPLEGLAFYRVVRTRMGAREVSVALASENLLPLLFRKETRKAVMVPMKEADWVLPGRVAAVLPDDDAIAALPDGAEGYVIGRWLPAAPGWHVAVRSRPLQSYPGYAMPAVVLIAWLVAATTTPAPHRLHARGRHLRRWLFLTAKIALLVLSGLFLVLAVQALTRIEMRPLVMPLYVVAFRWALVDQRQRCPECLYRLLLPVRIGVPSHCFLQWYGTELLCGEGHGLLQVPEPMTAAAQSQRWLHLDDFWNIPARRA